MVTVVPSGAEPGEIELMVGAVDGKVDEPPGAGGNGKGAWPVDNSHGNID